MRKKSVVGWFLISLAIFMNIVIFTGVGLFVAGGHPYWRPIRICDEMRRSFNMDRFLGEEYGTERVMLLGEVPAMALVHRLDLLERAQCTVYITTYLVQRTPTTNVFFEAVLRAADRGVTVNFLIDGLSNSSYGGIDPRIRDAMVGHPNISYFEFNPISIFRPRDLNITMHDKIFIVDETYMILGGMNIGDQYWDFENFQRSQSRHTNNIDSEALVFNTDTTVPGSIVEARYYVHHLIAHRMTRQRNVPSPARIARGMVRRVELLPDYNNFVHRWDSVLGNFCYYENTVPTKNITLLSNPLGTRHSQPVIAYNLLRIAENSDRVYIATPYVVLLNRDRAALARVAQNTDIIIATNAISNTISRRMTVHYVERRRTVATGVQFYEFQSRTCKIHSKHMIFDDRLSAIGSLNMEVNSFYFDTETMLVIDSVEFNRKLTEKTHGYLNQSLRVGTNNRYIQCENVQEIPISGWRHFWIRVRGFIMSGFKWLI